MNMYIKPIVIENEDCFEGVYAASGYSYDFYGFWGGHDSGHHSNLHVYLDLHNFMDLGIKRLKSIQFSFRIKQPMDATLYIKDQGVPSGDAVIISCDTTNMIYTVKYTQVMNDSGQTAHISISQIKFGGRNALCDDKQPYEAYAPSNGIDDQNNPDRNDPAPLEFIQGSFIPEVDYSV